MSVNAPEQVIQQWLKLFNSGDMEGLLELYEDDVLFVPDPGAEPVNGTAAMRSALQAFMDAGGTMSLVTSKTLTCGDLALCHDHWRFDPPDGEPMEATTSDVVRRQPDGSWKYVIDNPWGNAVVDGM